MFIVLTHLREGNEVLVPIATIKIIHDQHDYRKVIFRDGNYLLARESLEEIAYRVNGPSEDGELEDE